MAAYALPSLSSEAQMTGTAIVKNPEIPNSFCLTQLSCRSSLHQREFRYDTDDEPHSNVQRFHFQWSDEVLKLEKRSKIMKVDSESLAAGGHQQVDLRKAYDGES